MQTKRNSLVVDVAGVKIGGKSPIVIQSMTSGSRSNPDDVKKIAQEESKEAIALAKAGSELIRIALNSKNAALALPYIRQNLDESGFENVPLVGCGQYEIHNILKHYPQCIKSLGKLRINPGNIGFGQKRDKNFESVIESVCKYDLPIRIGVNWGSLDQDLLQQMMDSNASQDAPDHYQKVLEDALVSSALLSAKKAEEIGLKKNKIILSCKVSNFSGLVNVYRRLAKECDYPLHLGLTEAGMGKEGIVKTSVALGKLISEGIGDTIRASLTQEPGQSRTSEVELSKLILQSIEVRNFAPQITSCPGCGRTDGSYFQTLAFKIKNYVAENLEEWKKKYTGVENFKVAVMGCVVNGPGESKHANVGISLPGYGEKKVAAVFIDGQMTKKISGEDIFADSIEIIESYVGQKYKSIA